jgi:hypothetical protein
VGSTIKSKWHLDALLGVGGMAAVYAATHRNAQRAALKILHVDFARDKGVCERFTREAYVSNKVNHAACVQVLDDDFTEEGEPFLIMELLVGKTLREVWTEGGKRLPPLQVLETVDPILDCLVNCHEVGVIHRDLKPANIFLCDDGRIKVLDFGVAQFRSANVERTATGTALGTPSYMSPEQAMGLVDQLDGRTDLFSVGAIMHALITGQRINKGRTENEALIMAATTPVPSVARLAPDLPVEMVALIDKALAWDRRNRYTDARDMQRAVRATMVALGGRDPGAAVQAPGVPAMRAQASSDLGIPVEVEAPAADELPADDPRVVELRDAFKRIDRVLPSVRQFGWEHAATGRAMRGAFEAIAAIAATRPAEVAIRPYCFTWMGQTIWEPAPPFDAVPYNLFACGLRTLRMNRGVALEELREVLALFLLEPGRDLPPEDDLATALWERALPNVGYELADAFAEGDAAARESFYDEADAVELQAAEAARASRLEARAMAVSTDRSALSSGGRAFKPMALDDVVRAVFAAELSLSRDAWFERYVDVLLAALIDAARKKDANVVLSSLRASAADLVVAGGIDVVTRLHAALVERARERLPERPAQQVGGAVSSALFGAETLALMLRRLESEPERMSTFAPVLVMMSGKELPTVLAALERPHAPAVREHLLAYVSRVLPEREDAIAAAASKLDGETACSIVALLASAGTAGSRNALAALAQSEDDTVRTEARVRLAGSPEAAQGDLIAAVESGTPEARLAALRALVRHQVRGGWHVVARLVKQGDFADRLGEEQNALLDALLSLGGDRGEPIALEIAKKRSVIASEQREAVRVRAMEALGRYGQSTAAVDALREIASTRWGTGEDTRSAAQSAADRIVERARSGGG